MTAKEFLNQPYEINKQIGKKLQQLESLREMATSTTGSISDMPHSSSPDLQRIEGVLARIVDLENEVERDNEVLQDARLAVANEIANLDDGAHIRVMTKRYIELKDWKRVGQELGIGERWALKQHRAALQRFESMYTQKHMCK